MYVRLTCWTNNGTRISRSSTFSEIRVESLRRRKPATNVASAAGLSWRRNVSKMPSKDRGRGSGALLIVGAEAARLGLYRLTTLSIS